MDSKDIELLKVLENDARVPVKDIAVMLDISEEEVNNKIDAFLKNKIIRKFNTTIDWKRAKEEKVYAIIRVKIAPQERSQLEQICREISSDSKVIDSYVAAGEYDVIMSVLGDNIDEISEFILNRLTTSKYVVGTDTHFVFKTYKKNGAKFFENEVDRLKISL